MLKQNIVVLFASGITLLKLKEDSSQYRSYRNLVESACWIYRVYEYATLVDFGMEFILSCINQLTPITTSHFKDRDLIFCNAVLLNLNDHML